MLRRTYIPHLGLQCGLIIRAKDKNTSPSTFGKAARWGSSDTVSAFGFRVIKDRSSLGSPVDSGGGLILFQDNMYVGTYVTIKQPAQQVRLHHTSEAEVI